MREVVKLRVDADKKICPDNQIDKILENPTHFKGENLLFFTRLLKLI